MGSGVIIKDPLGIEGVEAVVEPIEVSGWKTKITFRHGSMDAVDAQKADERIIAGFTSYLGGPELSLVEGTGVAKDFVVQCGWEAAAIESKLKIK